MRLIDYHFRRADAVDPELKDVTIYSVRVQKSMWSKDPSPGMAPLLRSPEKINDFLAFIASREKDLAEDDLAEDMLSSGDYIGLLQLLCEEYPRMAFEYSVFRHTDGTVLLLGSGRTVVLDDYYGGIIKKALS